MICFLRDGGDLLIRHKVTALRYGKNKEIWNFETDENNVIILVMPQEARPIPSLPDWICKYSQKE